MSSISTSAAQSLVSVSNNHVITTSQSIATQFGKQHNHVLRDIKKLLSQLPIDHLSKSGQTPADRLLNFEETLSDARLNFEEIEYIDAQGRKYPAYNLTRDGFALLAMGFTGKNALQFKLKYLAAFNAMEAELVRIASESTSTVKTIASGLSPADQRTLQEAVNRKAMLVQEKDRPARFKKIYGGIKTQFRVGSYKDLDASQLRSAIEYVDSYAWQLLGAPRAAQNPIPLLDVSATADGLIKKLGDDRWMLFAENGKLKIEEMDADAFCLSMRELPAFLRDSAWPRKMLAEIIAACTSCLAEN